MLGFETAAISLLSAVVGGTNVAAVTHTLTRRRDADKRRAEKAVEYRVEARKAFADQTGPLLDSNAFEKALSEVALFGNEQEIQLVSKVMDDFVAHNAADTTELLKVLRQNIREELGLKKTSIEFRWLRINDSRKVRTDDGKETSEAKTVLNVQQD